MLAQFILGSWLNGYSSGLQNRHFAGSNPALLATDIIDNRWSTINNVSKSKSFEFTMAE